MHKLKKIYCRSFQTVFKLALPILPYRTPKIISSVKKLPEIIIKNKCQHVLIVTDTSIRSLGLLTPLEKALQDGGISYAIYDKTVANPTTVNVAEAEEQPVLNAALSKA